MKLTPLDIHHKEFRNSLRGYNQEEVDSFLDEVADEFERLFKENIDLSEKLEAANDKVRSYAEIERTLHNTMLAAQVSAEEIKAKADKEADILLRDAEIKAKELIQGALADKQRTQGELMRIKSAEDDFRLRFRSMLEEYMRQVRDTGVESGTAAFVSAEADERVLDLHVQSTRATPEPSPMPEPELEPVPEPAPGPKPIPRFKPDLDAAAAASAAPVDDQPSRPQARVTRHLDEGTQPLPLDPPSTGFVQSLTLGEVEGPDVRPDSPTFESAPGEFRVPRRGLVGDRDDDVDIEEID
ncbi:MAG: DivIVA domain-containing protein [Coriobacteriia bacterium]|nr:DivIVA domain-containing protein [Coriobacteriia bacterium]